MKVIQRSTPSSLQRPEFERQTLDARNVGEIVRPLSAWERLTNITAVRRLSILVALAVLWLGVVWALA